MIQWVKETWPLSGALVLILGLIMLLFVAISSENNTRAAFLVEEAKSGRITKLTDHNQPFRIYKVQTEDGYVLCTREWGCYVPAAKRVEHED